MAIFFKGVKKMCKKDKIEMIRNILNNATNMNIKKELIFKISQKFDEYIIKYYKENNQHKNY